MAIKESMPPFGRFQASFSGINCRQSTFLKGCFGSTPAFPLMTGSTRPKAAVLL
jgi:hypothetical protein